jgi:hypothetical protein
MEGSISERTKSSRRRPLVRDKLTRLRTGAGIQATSTPGFAVWRQSIKCIIARWIIASQVLSQYAACLVSRR